MGLKLSDVTAAFESSLLDAAAIFGAPSTGERTAALARHLDAAATDYSRARPLLRADSLALQAALQVYAAPADALGFHSADFADVNAGREPYEDCSVPLVPTPTIAFVDGVRSWKFRAPITGTLIGRFGSAYGYQYFARHVLSDTPADSTLDVQDQPLLLLRAQAEAMKELAMRNHFKPVQLRDGMYSQTKNGTPAGLAELLMKLFDAQTRPDTMPYRAGQ